jgi:serine/threonine protein kinase
VDLWSVGCILGEMHRGKALFPGKNHVDMLRLYWEHRGSPQPEDIEWVPKDSEARQFLDRFCPAGRSTQLRKLLPTASRPCLDLVHRLLDWDPTSRPPAWEAQEHEYLRRYLPKTAPEVPDLFDWTFDRYKPTPKRVQERLYVECARFHPEILDRDSQVLQARGFFSGAAASSLRRARTPPKTGRARSLHSCTPAQESKRPLPDRTVPSHELKVPGQERSRQPAQERIAATHNRMQPAHERLLMRSKTARGPFAPSSRRERSCPPSPAESSCLPVQRTPSRTRTSRTPPPLTVHRAEVTPQTAALERSVMRDATPPRSSLGFDSSDSDDSGCKADGIQRQRSSDGDSSASTQPTPTASDRLVCRSPKRVRPGGAITPPARRMGSAGA